MNAFAQIQKGSYQKDNIQLKIIEKILYDK